MCSSYVRAHCPSGHAPREVLSDPPVTLVVMDISTVLAAVVIASLGVLTGVVLTDLARKRRTQDDDFDVSAEFEQLHSAIDRLQAVHAAQLDTALTSQHQFFAATADGIRQDTARLTKALSRSEVRGRWGEMQLRRLVESAGLLDKVHFTEQDTVRTEDGVLRPDLIVHISDERVIVIDAKVPLDAILTADSDSAPAEIRAAHAAAVSAHIERLSKKEYWRQYDTSPEFVVMFLPAESLLAEALAESPELLERAFDRRIVLATPTTLMALLKTVGQVWQAEALTANAREIQGLASELYSRLGIVSDHLSKLGRSLKGSVDAYNTAVGSFEGRLVVTARKLHENGIGSSAPASPEQLTHTVRTISGFDEAETGIRAV